MTVRLEFVGHACFRVLEEGRPTLVTDPFSLTISGNETIAGIEDSGLSVDGDVVIVSSLTDPAHDNVALVNGGPQVINALDVANGRAEATINGRPLAAIPAGEIPDHPDGPEDNALYSFRAGGLWFAHMGDVGYELGREELAPWKGRCDVLLALVGAGFTVPLDALDRMIDILQPTWIVPMHYALPPFGFRGVPGANMSPVDVFLNRRPRDPVILARHHTITFPARRDRNGRPTIVVLEPSGYRATAGLPEFCVAPY